MKVMSIAIVALMSISAAQLWTAEEPATIAIPLRIHLVQSDKESALNTTMTEDDVKRVLGKVNKIWSQANIRFEVESIEKTAAVYNPDAKKDSTDRWVVTAMPKECLLKNGLNIFYVKELTPNGFFGNGLIFVKDTAKLAEVPGGVDEPLPRVTSHEIGHALGLPHRQDLTNLMASGKTGFLLNTKEIETARATAAAKFGAAVK